MAFCRRTFCLVLKAVFHLASLNVISVSTWLMLHVVHSQQSRKNKEVPESDDEENGAPDIWESTVVLSEGVFEGKLAISMLI